MLTRRLFASLGRSEGGRSDSYEIGDRATVVQRSKLTINNRLPFKVKHKRSKGKPGNPPLHFFVNKEAE